MPLLFYRNVPFSHFICGVEDGHSGLEFRCHMSALFHFHLMPTCHDPLSHHPYGIVEGYSQKVKVIAICSVPELFFDTLSEEEIILSD